MARPHPVSLLELARYFSWLGTIGFGGPVVLVERRRIPEALLILSAGVMGVALHGLGA